jgi:predicted TIM-barrel fold metal-dependent hydrolase
MDDASYVVAVQRAHPRRFAIVSPMNPDDPAVEEAVAEWKEVPGAVAVRVLISASSGNDPNAPGIPRILRAAARHGLLVNLQMGGNFKAGTALVDAHLERALPWTIWALPSPTAGRRRPTPGMACPVCWNWRGGPMRCSR